MPNVMERKTADPGGFANGDWLPGESRLAMPIQDFSTRPERIRPSRPRALNLHRLGISLLAAAMTAGFGTQLFFIVSFTRLTSVLLVFMIVATLTFAWVALGVAQTVWGYVLIGLRANGPIELSETVAMPEGRTALLFPVYREDPTLIAGTIEAIAHDLERLGAADRFHVFVLSDTPDEPHLKREQRVFRTLAAKVWTIIPIYYRRRIDNVAKKSGNLQDWIERFGDGYDYFVVLDADSIMSAGLLVRLAAVMDRDADLALVQTVPRLVGGTTRFQKFQQFAASRYGPAASIGLAAFNGREGNYWGHNAIIRTRSFAQSAGLPMLPGRPPWSGCIRSHDFVEAALLLRSGWDVVMVPVAAGSYESSPPSLIEHAIRDRRWQQGNLQHAVIATKQGLSLSGRLHLVFGIVSYLASAAWMTTLVVGLTIAWAGSEQVPHYFGSERSLFPLWPKIDPVAALRLFTATMAVVLMPKLLALAWAIFESTGIKHYCRTAVGVTIETTYAVLAAPLMMAVHVCAFLEVLWGLDSGWPPQRRSGEGVSFREALAFCWPYSATGGVLAFASALASTDLLLWASPVCAGLLLAPLTIWFTSFPAGRLLDWGLQTKDELAPPPIVAVSDRYACEWRSQPIPIDER